MRGNDTSALQRLGKARARPATDHGPFPDGRIASGAIPDGRISLTGAQPIGSAAPSKRNPLFVDVPTACHELGDIGRTSFYGLVKKGKLKICKIESKSVVAFADLERLADEIMGRAA